MKIKDRWGADAKLKFEELILEAEDQMTKPGDIDFVKSMKANHAKWGVHTWLSDKQLAWLQRIAGNDEDDALRATWPNQ